MADATVKLKPEAAEKAFKRLFDQMDKDVKKRQWTPATYSALICYLAEACGGKFPDKDSRANFRKLMEDSDFSFSSNGKKYAITRGWMPKADEYATAALE